MPQARQPRARFEAGYNVVDLFTDAGVVPSKSEGRRLVQQGGAFIATGSGAGGGSADSDAGLEALGDLTALIGAERLDGSGELVLRAGKKRYCRILAV
jgi:tyrosyl-tRNA synthetase